MHLVRPFFMAWSLASVLAGQEPAPRAGGEATVVVRGRAVDEEGRPIAGACLALGSRRELCTEDALRAPVARSRADGRFELSWTMPADPRARWGEARHPLITAPGRGAALWSGPILPAARENARNLGDVVLPRAVVLAGRVRDAAGRPVAGARVVAADVLARLTTRSGAFRSLYFVSAGRTDDDGRFVLPGVLPPAADLMVRADGYHAAYLPFATPRDPLEIELEPGGFVAGTVRDRDGKPCRALVRVGYEVGDPRWTPESDQVTGEDGAFRINLDHPHRYRVEAWSWTSDGYAMACSEVLAGARSGVVLRPPLSPGDRPALIVRVVDAATGAAVEGARAAAFWSASDRPSFAEHQFATRAVSGTRSGEVRLPGPRVYEPRTATVLVKAEGYVDATLEGVAWDEAEPTRREVKLVREAVITGVVVDGATGKSLEGALVVAGDDVDGFPWALGFLEPTESGLVTDGAGRFRVGGLAAGEHTIRAGLPPRPDSAPLVVALAAGEQREAVELVVPPGAELLGKLRGAPARAGLAVRLVKRDESSSFAYSGFDPFGQQSRVAPVASDGSFALHGLAQGDHALELLVAPRHGRGCGLVIPVERVRIAAPQAGREIDVGDLLPGAIEGRLVLGGASIPTERLAVTATRSPEAGAASETFGEDVAYAFVGSDGAFHLEVAAGCHGLQVVDLATGIVLLEAPDSVAVEPTTVVYTELGLEFAEVRVRLVPADGQADVVASQLEVVVEHPRDNPLHAFAWFDPPSSAGVSLADGKREVALLLPAVPTTFRVRSHLADLLRDPTDLWIEHERLPAHEFVPRIGELNRVEIVVPAKEK